MEIGKIIKEKRTLKNMTQEDLANEFFVSRQLISKWENGKSYPDLEQLLKLSAFFDLTLDELMRGDKKMTKKLNTTIKRKSLFVTIIIILLLGFIPFGYFIWADQTIQLEPADIEIISIKVEQNYSIEKENVDTKKKITLPKDVSYTIKYKVNKPFTEVRSGHYFGQDADSIYIDMRGKKTLFPSKKENTFIISSDAKMYGENNNIEIDNNYEQRVIKNKDIKILDIDDYSGKHDENYSDSNSWEFIKKDKLKN